MPLAFAPEGGMVRVVGVRGGFGVGRRMAELGFTPNAILKIVKSGGLGPILVEVKGSRLAVGRGVAMKVMVEPL